MFGDAGFFGCGVLGFGGFGVGGGGGGGVFGGAGAGDVVGWERCRLGGFCGLGFGVGDYSVGRGGGFGFGVGRYGEEAHVLKVGYGGREGGVVGGLRFAALIASECAVISGR